MGYPAPMIDLKAKYEPKANDPGNSASNSSDNDESIRLGDHTDPCTYNPYFTAAVLDCEMRDLDVLLVATEAEYVLGVSSAALILLLSLLTAESQAAYLSFTDLKGITKAIIVEPPPHHNPSDNLQLGHLNPIRGTVSGNTIAAIATATLFTQTGPAGSAVDHEEPFIASDLLPRKGEKNGNLCIAKSRTKQGAKGFGCEVQVTRKR